MGRSQVAYNRTKLRVRGGRGGSVSGRGETGDRSVSSNQSHRSRHESNTSNSNDSNDNYDNDTAAPSVSSSWRKPKRYPRDRDAVNYDNHDEDNSSRQSDSYGYNEADAAANFKNAEADLLLDMQSAQAYAYATPSSAEAGMFPHHNNNRDRDGSGGLNLLSSGGGDGDSHSAVLNVSAMAAALNKLPLSQRFMIPRHLAATLVINGEDDDEEEDTECEEKEESEAFHEYEVESVRSGALRDTVVPVPPMDAPSVQAKVPIPSSESISMLAGVPKPSEQLENHRRELCREDVVSVHPPKEVAVSTPAADPQRQRNLIQRASVTSPIDLMSDNDDDENPREYDDDDPMTRLRRLDMEGSPSREGDTPRAAFSQSISSTANATARTMDTAANTTSNNTSSTAAIIDCTSAGGEEDVDMWLDSALAGSELFETEHNGEGEGQLDDWLDGVIE